MKNQTTCLLIIFLALWFQVSAQTKSVPCECHHYTSLDSEDLNLDKIVKSEYNDDGMIVKNEVLDIHRVSSEYNAMETTVTTYKNDYQYAESITSSQIGKQKPLFKYKRIKERDDDGEIIRATRYSWDETKWVKDSIYTKEDLVKKYTYTYTARGNISTKTPIAVGTLDWYQQYVYKNDSLLLYILGGYRDDSTSIRLIDSTVYDYSQLSSNGIITKTRFLIEPRYRSRPSTKTVTQYANFQIPDVYIIGNEYSDTINRELSETQYEWGKETGEKYFGLFDNQSFKNRDITEYKWREDPHRRVTEYLPNGGRVYKSFYMEYLEDSIRYEVDSNGYITSKATYIFERHKVNDFDIDNPQYNHVLGESTIHNYTRTFDAEGNLVDYMYHYMKNRRNAQGGYKSYQSIDKRQCSEFITVPDRWGN